MNQRRKMVVYALAVVVALSMPLSVSADEVKDNDADTGKLPVAVVETAEYKCHEKPPICNCMDAEKCTALEKSGHCKEGTYNFWKENTGTCIWNGTK